MLLTNLAIPSQLLKTFTLDSVRYCFWRQKFVFRHFSVIMRKPTSYKRLLKFKVTLVTGGYFIGVYYLWSHEPEIWSFAVTKVMHIFVNFRVLACERIMFLVQTYVGRYSGRYFMESSFRELCELPPRGSRPQRILLWLTQ